MCACRRPRSSSLPQIELLINRPTPTWQTLHFSTTVLIVSQILLIWQNPKIKQSPNIFHSACLWSPVPCLSNGFRMFGMDSQSLPIHLPFSTRCCPGSRPCSWPLSVCGTRIPLLDSLEPACLGGLSHSTSWVNPFRTHVDRLLLTRKLRSSPPCFKESQSQAVCGWLISLNFVLRHHSTQVTLHHYLSQLSQLQRDLWLSN